MYAGRIVEHGPVGAIFDAPPHPYTQGLLQPTAGRAGPADGPVADLAGAPPMRPDPARLPVPAALPAGTDRCAEEAAAAARPATGWPATWPR